MRNFEDKILINGDMSGNITSSVVDLGWVVMFSIQAIYSGSPVGVLKLQASNDGVSWSDISGSTVSISAGGDTLYNVTDVAYEKVKLIYTRTSGAGTLNVTINAKGF